MMVAFMKQTTTAEPARETTGPKTSPLWISPDENGDNQDGGNPLLEWCRQLPSLCLSDRRWKGRLMTQGPNQLTEWCRQIPMRDRR